MKRVGFELIFREMQANEVLEVAKLYNALAINIKNETEDEYFVFDNPSLEDLSRQIESALRDDSKRIYIAKDEKIAGFISGEILSCFLPISRAKEVGYISAAFVLPEYRGRGIMKTLEFMLSNYFKSKNLNYIELHVISKNILAKETWKSLGYSTFREQMRKRI
jgi:ribosomal protein S18 acetylase RimI-like enzyme